jgi:hypothetical protein
MSHRCRVRFEFVVQGIYVVFGPSTSLIFFILYELKFRPANTSLKATSGVTDDKVIVLQVAAFYVCTGALSTLFQ